MPASPENDIEDEDEDFEAAMPDPHKVLFSEGSEDAWQREMIAHQRRMQEEHAAAEGDEDHDAGDEDEDELEDLEPPLPPASPENDIEDEVVPEPVSPSHVRHHRKPE